MKLKWLAVVLLIPLIFLFGCISPKDEIKPEFYDNALKFETEIIEKIEGMKIFPGQTIRMVVLMTNQVEEDTMGVDLKISDPVGITISRVDCSSGCVCEWNNWDTIGGCNEKINCSFNGCYFDKVQSLDQHEIDFSLKIPSEEEISSFGWSLKPKLTLEYNYSGNSVLYIPIIKQGEKMEKPPSEFTQTHGPIHVDIESDKWVSNGSIFPLYVDVKDVVDRNSRIEINQSDFLLYIPSYIQLDETTIGRCDFNKTDGYYTPKKQIILPLRGPLVCTLKANTETLMIKAPIITEYSYRYRVEKTEDINVERVIA